jgi:hypothetical protein
VPLMGFDWSSPLPSSEGPPGSFVMGSKLLAVGKRLGSTTLPV